MSVSNYHVMNFLSGYVKRNNTLSHGLCDTEVVLSVALTYNEECGIYNSLS